MKRTWFVPAVLIIDSVMSAMPCGAAVGTAFTYQGRLDNGGSPVNGAYDFQFTLYDAATAGNQVGSTVAKDDLNVTNGYFTTTLDFGSGIFTGNARWLQIAVRPGTDTGSYTTLATRQELTPVPYAINLGHTGTANYIPKFTSDSMANSAIYQSGNNVGIGVTGPTAKLEVAGTGGTFPIVASAPLGGWAGFGINGYTPGTTAIKTAFVKQRTSSYGVGKAHILNDVTLSAVDADLADARMTIDTSGNMGIATTAPTQKLDVSGTVQCVSLIQTSDAQLKTDVRPLTAILEKLDKVSAVSFQWNEKAQALGAPAGTRQIGVLAQELEQVFPELVTTPTPITVEELTKDYPPEGLTAEVRQRFQQDSERTQYKAVNYSELTVVLLQAVKELQAQNKALEQRIQALEAKVQ